MQTQLKRYVIGQKLGQGGFGITYRGFDLKLRMEVAIKEYFPSDFVSRADDRKTLVLNSRESAELFGYGLKAFTKEAHTLAQLKHPNLVRVLNLFEMNATAYLVMDYYEGETIHDYLTRKPGRKLPWREAIQVLLPVLDGLQVVHDQGFLHRDIKPRNLYRTHQGQIILLDFGAARQVVSDRSRHSSLAIYSSGYAAFEQHVQGKQGPWTDVYGVAATLYFLLTGQTPPAADARAMDDAIKPPRHHVPELPPALDNILRRALAVKSEQRLQSTQELKQQLEAVLATEAKKPSSNGQGARKPPRKLNARAAAIALSLAILGWGVWLVFSNGKTPPAPRTPTTAPIAEPVPRPPVPPQVKGTLAIRSEPPGAAIRVDDALLGSAPQDFVHPEGRVTVEARLEGYQPRQEAVWIMTGRRSEVVMRLEPVPQPEVTTTPPAPPVEPVTPPVAEPAVTLNPNPERTYLTVKTEPPGAQVRIMNIGPAYRDGIELLPGDYDLEVSAPGYQTDRAWHNLAAGAQELKIALLVEPPPPAMPPPDPEDVARQQQLDLQLTVAKKLLEAREIPAARRALDDAKAWDRQGAVDTFRREQTELLQSAARAFLDQGQRSLAERVVNDLEQWDPQAPEYAGLRKRLANQR
ncbi:MAG: protein kinase [Candidatus Competibacter sp.]|nr:protein kinase [Candidatus Competibacter sp.]MDG4585143.1 protein kinase [Candidatus Competibacter sp.]